MSYDIAASFASLLSRLDSCQNTNEARTLVEEERRRAIAAGLSEEWPRFLLRHGHLLARGRAKQLLQLALSISDESPITQVAEELATKSLADTPHLRRRDRPKQTPPKAPCQLTIEAHHKRINAIDCQKDFALSGGEDTTLRLWDIKSGLCLASLQKFSAPVGAVSLSPSLQWALVGCEGTITLWNLQTLGCLFTTQGHRKKVTALTFLDDETFISGGDDGAIKLWSLRTWKFLRKLSGHQKSVSSLLLSLDKRRLISAADDVRVWDIESGKELFCLSDDSAFTRSISLHPDGTKVLVRAAEHDNSLDNRYRETLRFWSLSTGERLEELTRLQDGTSHVNGLFAIHPDGKRAVMSPYSSELVLFDLSTQETLQKFRHPDAILSLSFLPDGTLVTTNTRGQIRRWDLEVAPRPQAEGQQELIGGVSFWLETTQAALLPKDEQRGASASDSSMLSGTRTIKVFGPNEHTLSVPASDWIAVSPDGAQAASTNKDGVLRLFDSNNPGIPGRLASTGEIRSFSVSPDGKLTATNAGVIQLWDLEKRTLLHTLETWGPLLFWPDGKRFITKGQDKTIQIWDLTSWHSEHIPNPDGELFQSFYACPDGERLLSVDSQQHLSLWDLASRQRLRTISIPQSAFLSVALTQEVAIVASWGGAIKIWNLATGKSLSCGERYEMSVAVHPDQQRFASGGSSGVLVLWEIETAKKLKELKGHTSRIAWLQFLSDGRLVSHAEDNTCRLWDVEEGKCLLTLKAQGYFSTVRLSHDQQKLFTITSGKRLEAFDLSSGAQLWSVQGPWDNLKLLAALPDGQRVLTASEESTLRRWDITTGACIRMIEHVSVQSIKLTSFCADKDRVVLVSHPQNKLMELFNLETGQREGKLEGHQGAISAVVVTKENIAFSASEDKTIKRWDLTSLTCQQTLLGHTGPIWQLLLHPEEKRLLSRSEDLTIRVWDTETGQEVSVLKGHTDRITSMALHPNGRWLASTSADGTLRVWETPTGRELLRWESDAPVEKCAFSSRGLLVFSDWYGDTLVVECRGLS